jgi:hypothetical protein
MKILKSVALTSVITACIAFSPVALAQTYYGETSQEQNGAKSSEEKMADGLELLNKKCGSQATANIDWNAYGTFTEADRDGRTRDNIYLIAGTLVYDTLSIIAQRCESDAIFKGNVAKKVKTIAFTPAKGKLGPKNPSHVYKLSGGVLAVKYNFQSMNQDNLNEVLKLI